MNRTQVKAKEAKMKALSALIQSSDAHLDAESLSRSYGLPEQEVKRMIAAKVF